MFTFNYFGINIFTIDVIIKYHIFADSHLKHCHSDSDPPIPLKDHSFDIKFLCMVYKVTKKVLRRKTVFITVSVFDFSTHTIFSFQQIS